jgi:hypothetical protein
MPCSIRNSSRVKLHRKQETRSLIQGVLWSPPCQSSTGSEKCWPQDWDQRDWDDLLSFCDVDLVLFFKLRHELVRGLQTHLHVDTSTWPHLVRPLGLGQGCDGHFKATVLSIRTFISLSDMPVLSDFELPGITACRCTQRWERTTQIVTIPGERCYLLSGSTMDRVTAKSDRYDYLEQIQSQHDLHVHRELS